MDQNLKIQLGNINQKVGIMKGMGLSPDEIEKSFSKLELDIIEKARPHKYIRKEGERYIYDEPKGHESQNLFDRAARGELSGKEFNQKVAEATPKNSLSDSPKDHSSLSTEALKEKIKLGKELYNSWMSQGKKMNETSVNSVFEDLKKMTEELKKREQPEKKEVSQYKDMSVDQLEKIKKDLMQAMLENAGHRPNEGNLKMLGEKAAEVQREIVSRGSEKKEESVDEEKEYLSSITENSSVEDIRHKLFDLTNQDQRMKVTTVSGASYYTTVKQERLDLYKESNQQAKAGIKKIELDKSESTIQKSEESPSKEAKVAKVMREFKDGKLKSSSGELVTDHDQAIAIAMSEAGLSKGDNEVAEDGLEKGGEGSRGGKVIGRTRSGKPIYDTRFTTGDKLVVKDKSHKWYGKTVHVQSINRATDQGSLKQHSYLVGTSPTGNAEAIGENSLGFGKE